MDRAIVHMDLDSFFVSCERLVDSRLNGIPLIIGGNSERSVVSSCSYEARKFGVRSAMPVKAALRLCPQATVVNVNMELYSKLSKSVTQIIAERAPLFEKASIDEFYLDITGMDKFFGNYKWTNELTELITKETGLPISFGLSVNKTVAKIATGEGKPNGKMHIEQQQVRTFLNPLSIRKIPFLGKASFEALTGIGIHTIRDLAQT
ncbi:MAG TPA: DNA polymerase IV, partial [Taishania sp.]|nr:DNA polymerase IV [Taishania sp.]